MLERLGEIRRAIAGEITDAGGVDAVRAALSRLFSAFVLHPQESPHYEGQGRSEPVDVGHDLMIELVVHERALEGHDERLLQVLRRKPLANDQSVGSATR